MKLEVIRRVLAPITSVEGDDGQDIRYLLTDSRQLGSHPDQTLFFALRTDKDDGANYIPDLQRKGVRAFVRKNPTVYCGTHTPLGYENLEAKRVVDLDHPPVPLPPGEFVRMEATGKYVCSVCGRVYDPAEGDPEHGIPAGTKFEDLPDDWKCPRCRQPKSKFNRA